MITEVDGSIFKLPEYSVLIHQGNNKGWMGIGISKEIFKRWPISFEKYHNYCRTFRDGHEDELLGSFSGHNVSSKLIVCTAIAQYTIGKSQQQTDFSAWEEICKKLRSQTLRANKLTGKKWTLHVPYKVGCSSSNGKWDMMMEIFERYFTDSEIDLVIHHY